MFAVLSVAPVEARVNCNKQCQQRVAKKQCSQKRVIPCIRHASLRWNVNIHMLLRKARCESGLNPYAVGFIIHRGLFQFNFPGTWGTTPYAKHDPFRALWNSLAAAWMHHVGRGGEWQCQ